RRRYSYTDLLELKVIKTLLDAGIKLESVRGAFTFLRDQLGQDVASANLVINGSRAVFVHTDELIDLINKGQGVLILLSLRTVKDELDSVIELHPTEADTVAPASATSTVAAH